MLPHPRCLGSQKLSGWGRWVLEGEKGRGDASSHLGSPSALPPPAVPQIGTSTPERERSHNSGAELVTFCLALLTPPSYGVRALAAFRVVECFSLLPSQKILQ